MGNKKEAETMAIVHKIENFYHQPGLYFGYLTRF